MASSMPAGSADEHRGASEHLADRRCVGAAPMVPGRPQLLTYPDSLGGSLRAIRDLLDGPLAGLFRGVHVLPPYPSSGDRGFAPIAYDPIDPRFGTWADVEAIARTHSVVLDVMVNHISSHSPEFAAFLRGGLATPEARLFLRPDSVWPGGQPPPEDMARIFRRRPQGPFSTVTTASGERITVWTTFGAGEVSEQIDLDLRAPEARELVTRWLAGLASHGVSVVRLDAVGYVVKRAGTSCFMVQPEIDEFLAWIATAAGSLGLTVLPEIHDRPSTREHLSALGYWTYDFALPGLVLHALATGESSRLAAHLAASPAKQVTMLDCHDGIPVRPDLEGVLERSEMQALAGLVVARGGNIARLLSASDEGGVDVHQLNISYPSALAGDGGPDDDERYLAARAIQLFARGIPQVYHVGLLAGANDPAAHATTGDGRAVNRHDFTREEIDGALQRPVVRRQLQLIRLRNEHPAFDGELAVRADASTLAMRWKSGSAEARLEVDLATPRWSVDATPAPGV